LPGIQDYGLLVDFLALHNWRLPLGVRGARHLPLVSQLPGLGPQRPFCGLVVAMVEFPVDDFGGPVAVLRRQDLSVLDRLHHAAVVVLMDLLVEGRVNFLVLGGLDRLLGDGPGGFLMHRGIVMPGSGREAVDCCLGFFHLEGLWQGGLGLGL
jgi:hypothetical protein